MLLEKGTQRAQYVLLPEAAVYKLQMCPTKQLLHVVQVP